jgi:hypothetical protein
MIFWLESQPVAVIVIIGYTPGFSMAAATFIVVWQLSRTRFFAICFVLFLVHDRPFRSGGLTVDPIGSDTLLVE